MVGKSGSADPEFRLTRAWTSDKAVLCFVQGAQKAFDLMSPEIAQRTAEIAQLCRRFSVRRFELFGSAATGTNQPGQSDLDFLVEFESLPSGAYADAFFGLLESLEKLFGHPVDLVVGSAIKNPYFRQAIEPTRVLLYAA